MLSQIHTTSSQAQLGIGAGITAGAFWGLVFLAPELTPGFSPLQLSAGRYLAYGIVAAVLIARSWPRLVRSLSWADWRGLAGLSLLGNIVYYLFVAQAVQSGGVAMTSIVIGLLPLAVTLAGLREHGAVPLRRLAPSLLLGGAGLACISWDALRAAGGSGLGLLCALGALVSWTIYAVVNRRWLARLQGVSSQEWSLLMGVMTGAQALLLAVPAFQPGAAAHSGAEWLHFLGVVSAVGIFCSVVGNALWNYASRALPMALMGQMIVFETVFASLYGFLWEGRWPNGMEAAALLLLLAGVASCAAAHRN
ncbi:DMT family transporter [Massilia sp. IC2-476]|uniref:DMT family transporter n=1 Tax=Massilia sp. IC2-476 TaxID=2887199 RepID=UPI001D106630|nr:DMT family transporter [Massilia sp. IC2-476]MCC2973687.1 DMT family transporter [Massilia sp. IC2-476]